MKVRAFIRTCLTILATVLSATACSKVERVQDTELKEIAMSPLSSTMSKVVGGVLDSYPQEESIGVSAYYSEFGDAQSWTSDVLISSYFENKEFKYNSEAVAWAGVTPAYWPPAGSLIFAGYSPYCQVGGAQVQNVVFDSEIKTLTISGYQVEQYVGMTEAEMYDGGKQYVNKQQSDLMYFLPKTDAYGNFVGTLDGTAYPVNFNHALAQVVFTVRAEVSDDVELIRLRKIVFCDIASKGDFAATIGRTQMGYASWKLSEGGEFQDQTVLNNPSPSGGMRLSVSPRKVVEFMTIPIGEHDIKITYTLIVNGKLYEETMTFQAQWETGKKYTYNLILGTDKIELVPQITTDWVTNE